MRFQEYLEEVRIMNLPLGKYAILGSGPLAVRGVRDTKDVDLIVTPDIYDHYRKQEGWKLKFAHFNFFLKKGNVEIWKRIGFMKSRMDIQYLIDRSELIEGLPFVNMHDFICWKKKAYRKKDKRDVILAKKWLSNKIND